MTTLVLKNVGRYALTLFIASIVIFVSLRIIPGNPAEIALGVTATPESVAQLSAQMGIDQPVWTQYWNWVSGIMVGDFGLSLTSKTEISVMVIDSLMVSLILVGLAMIFALCVAIPLGVWSAYRSQRIDGLVITVFSQLGIAVPSFLAAILLVSLFAVKLGWFPANGWVVPADNPSQFAQRLVLPVVSLGIVQSAIMLRYVRSSILEILNEDFMRTARAKGLSVGQALWSHGLRNAALPVITVTGVQLTTVLVGAVVIEKVFVIPGLGSMLLTAVTNRDLPTVQTIVMLLVIVAVIINAIVDLAYGVVDPRIRRKS